MRALDGSGELAVPSYELFSGTEILGRMAMERMLAGLSTRRYPVGLEPVGARTEQTAATTSKSAVSRRFVAATETALSELLAADLSSLKKPDDRHIHISLGHRLPAHLGRRLISGPENRHVHNGIPSPGHRTLRCGHKRPTLGQPPQL